MNKPKCWKEVCPPEMYLCLECICLVDMPRKWSLSLAFSLFNPPSFSQWRSSWRTIILWEEPGYRAASKPRRWSSTGARAMVQTAQSTASMAGDSPWRWAPVNLSPTSVPYLNKPAPPTPNSGPFTLFCGVRQLFEITLLLGTLSQEHSRRLCISNGSRFFEGKRPW